jgi:hypothetical protein
MAIKISMALDQTTKSIQLAHSQLSLSSLLLITLILEILLRSKDITFKMEGKLISLTLTFQVLVPIIPSLILTAVIRKEFLENLKLLLIEED